MTKKFFLIGGAGFIGSYISRLLLNMGHQVVIYDAFFNLLNPFTSNYDFYLKARLGDIIDKLIIERGNIRNQRHLSQIIRKHQPDIIIHLAAIPSAKESALYPEEAASVNSDGLLNTLESLRAADNLERFVFTSSSFVYGNFQYEPADENHPTNPIDVYGGSKLAGEFMTKTHCKELGIPYSIVRPTAVYGFGDINKRVSQVIIENAFAKRPVILHGGGETKIDFTYIEDTATGFVLVALKKESIDETFNIARGEGRRVADFAAIVKRHFPDLQIISQPADMARPERGSLDITKAKTLLGFEPKFSLEEGIAKYIQDLKAKGPKEVINPKL